MTAAENTGNRRVKIQPFTPVVPELWFQQIEWDLEEAGCTTSLAKFKAVSKALKHRYAREVRDLILNPPDKDRSNDLDETYTGSLSVFDEQHVWISEKCVPLVREITFENAEELTEEGLPFLILFHNPDDKDSIKKYNEIVLKELLGEKQNINFLTADGNKFAHPLHHLGKSDSDLPLIAIDSFRHMYLFPTFKDMEIPGKLMQFINDLYSGKLHREFHYATDPDATEEMNEVKGRSPTNPPESTFFHY